MSTIIAPSPLLRAALAIDSAASGVMGLGLTFAAAPLSGLLGLPQPLLVGVGLVCIAWAGVTGWLARRREIQRGLVWAVIALNAAWVAESLLLLASGWFSPTGLGTAFVLCQAIAVAIFAEAQFIGLRRTLAARMVPA